MSGADLSTPALPHRPILSPQGIGRLRATRAWPPSKTSPTQAMFGALPAAWIVPYEAIMSPAVPEITFHYPPELFDLLVDAIPRLNRTKRGLLLFFQGAGVPKNILNDLQRTVTESPSDITKFAITCTVLERLNARGEATLRERREVLRRVVEFTNYDSCWPDDRLRAKGLVASVRDVVNQKDSFTRMKQERDLERRARALAIQRAARRKERRLQSIRDARDDFYSLFRADTTGQARGRKLESALNKLFGAYGMRVREAFHLVGQDNEGIVEQVDGVIEHKAHIYFVEMKWYSSPVGRAEVSEHLVRLMSRAEGRGIFVSASEYTRPAVAVARDFLNHKVLVLATLEEIVGLLETEGELSDLLTKKVNAALIDRNPYFRPYMSR